MKVPDLLVRTFNAGAAEGQAPPVRRRVVLSNQIAAIVVVIAIFGASGGIDAGRLAAFALLAAVAVSVPALNGLGRITASRLVLIAVPPLVLVLAPAVSGRADAGYLLALPYALLTMSLLPVILFHHALEPGCQRLGALWLGLVLLGHEWVLAAQLPAGEAALVRSSAADTKAGQLILWLLINASGRFLAEEPGDTDRDLESP